MRLYLHPLKGLVAQLNSASDYGSEGYWFESSRGHRTGQILNIKIVPFFISSKTLINTGYF